MTHYLLSIDQGTTNSRAIIFDKFGNIASVAELPLNQSFPQPGWVEQNAEEMFENSLACCRDAMKKLNINATSIAAIGITNQRETTILWDKITGKPIHPAIVWQDRRTSDFCKQLVTDDFKTLVQEKTGLLLDPYFSATKIAWILDHVPKARERSLRGEILFGTVDTFLLWKLTAGKSHITDATNASRTLLFNVHTQTWDDALLNKFNIPHQILPLVYDNAANFGETEKSLLGGQIQIAGMAGDQQAATIGQACFQSGMVKTTYGTGCFMLLNTGKKFVQSSNQLLTTIAYRLNGDVTYGIEGSIFSAGSTVKWLRDTLKLIQSANETEVLARSIDNTGGVYLVPAFTGLGAPHWDPDARAAIIGLTRGSDKSHIVRAALESVSYQTADLLQAMQKDFGATISMMRVDGGMAANNWLLQFIADILNITVQRPVCIETTALGAAYLAGLQVGMYQSLDEIATFWRQQSTYHPAFSPQKRDDLYNGWQDAVNRVLCRKT